MVAVSLAMLAATSGAAQVAPAAAGLQYELRFDSASAATRTVRVALRFDVAGPGPLLLSLPAWTPGAYEISNFARKVSSFGASAGGRALAWDKTDHDTWRVRAVAPGQVEVRFDVLADTLDNAMAWSRPDFLLVNGTNVFLYPEGIGHDFPATLTVTTERGWIVATGMEGGGTPGRYRAGSYHDLVDMPIFVGRFDLDSLLVDGKWNRLASYPAGTFTGAARQQFWEQLRRVLPPMARVFGETPWSTYSTLLIFEDSFGGGSALEHQNSHVGIYNPQFMGTPILASITAHEIFHGWNVKRLRPAELVPYRYDAPQPTTLLWVSEGITDYYADLALLRGGVIDSTVFLNVTSGKINNVLQTPPVALEDASLSTWIHPTDGTDYIYYDKGSLAGFLLDVLIRDGSENRRSLDDVLRGLYTATFKRGRGFSSEEWWGAVRAAAGGKAFDEFASRYVDGRDPFPWAQVMPLAGLRFVVDSLREPRLGVLTEATEEGVTVTEAQPGGAAAEAGVRAGDRLVRVGEIEVRDQTFGEAFRARYATRDGQTVPVVVRRDGAERTLTMPVRLVLRTQGRLAFERLPGPKAARVRSGLLRGVTDP